MTEMTNREFYTIIMRTEQEDGIVEFAAKKLRQLDKANEKSRKRRMEKPARKENEALKDKILNLLSETVSGLTAMEGFTAMEIADSLSISTQKASALARQLVETGQLTEETVTLKGIGYRKIYFLAEE